MRKGERNGSFFHIGWREEEEGCMRVWCHFVVGLVPVCCMCFDGLSDVGNAVCRRRRRHRFLVYVIASGCTEYETNKGREGGREGACVCKGGRRRAGGREGVFLMLLLLFALEKGRRGSEWIRVRRMLGREKESGREGGREGVILMLLLLFASRERTQR